MPTELYLDTARLGRMHPAALAAARDFDRLCGVEGGSPLVERLIRDGAAGWPAPLRRRHPGLAGWGGIDALEDALRRVAGMPADADVHLAGRSAVQERLVARAMFRNCRRVLHTDLEWPAHLAILESERRRAGREAVALPVRDRAFRDGVDAGELAALVARGYGEHGCDGLFLVAVSHDGVRFPLGGLARAMASLPSPRFVAVDAAQAVGHTPPADAPCDALLAGAHKWLRSGRPLAMAFAPRPATRGLIREVAAEMESTGELDDPLLGLTRQLCGGAAGPHGATAEPSGLPCAMAAVAAGPHDPGRAGARLATLLANAAALAEAAPGVGWRPLALSPGLRTGILLLRARDERARRIAPSRLRALLHRDGVVLTAYAGGIVRASMPDRPWGVELDRVRSALRSARGLSTREGPRAMGR
jgi:hypothetical protein